ncbi:MAG: HyaD/HybD family hydrogenase maturation endopeptidase [Deltaproteobacteria bacterium]|jgi:hydrogenase maturation protease
MAEILILGLGNLFQSDDGVGVRVVEKMQERYWFSDNVRIVDGGTRGMALAPSLEGVARLLVVDAVESQREPGALTRLVGEEVLSFPAHKALVHQDGLSHLLRAAGLLGAFPEEIVLLGVEPVVLDPGMELSPAVSVRVDELIDMALRELRRWGVKAHSKKSERPAV